MSGLEKAVQDILARTHVRFAKEIKDRDIAQLLTLLQRREKEAELHGIDTAIKAYKSTCEALIVEAVKQEQKRILGKVRHSAGFDSPDGTTVWFSMKYEDWVALSERLGIHK